MPQNARLFLPLRPYDPESVTLETRDGEPVPFVLEPAGDVEGLAFWGVPAGPLAPGAYSLWARHGDSTGARQRFDFEVSLPEDHTSPDASGLRVLALANDYCSALTGARFTWDVPATEPLAASEVELWRGETRIAHFFARGAPEVLEFGTSANLQCFGNIHVEGLVAGEELTARVRAWDLAGNMGESESATFTVTHVEGRRCERNCAAAPFPGAPSRLLMSFLVAAVTVAIRRARRRLATVGSMNGSSRS